MSLVAAASGRDGLIHSADRHAWGRARVHAGARRTASLPLRGRFGGLGGIRSAHGEGRPVVRLAKVGSGARIAYLGKNASPFRTSFRSMRSGRECADQLRLAPPEIAQILADSNGSVIRRCRRIERAAAAGGGEGRPRCCGRKGG